MEKPPPQTPRVGAVPVCARVFEIEQKAIKPKLDLGLTELMAPVPQTNNQGKTEEQIAQETMDALFGPTPRELKGKSFLKA
jgi:hypothetical protein